MAFHEAHLNRHTPFARAFSGGDPYLDNHHVGRVIIKHLGDPHYVLSIPAEADLSDDLKNRILAVCRELQGLGPASAVLIPTKWGEPNGYLSPDLAIELGLLPQDAARAISAHMTAIDAGKRPSFQDLQRAPLKLTDIAGSLERGSALEWHAFTLEFGGSALSLDPREFVTNLVNFMKNSVDPETRHDLACKALERIKREIVIIPELGSDIPVTFNAAKPVLKGQNSPLLDVNFACGLGLELLVIYVKSAKYWVILDLKHQVGDLTKLFPVSKVQPTNINAFIAYTFSDLKDCVDYIRSKARVKLDNVAFASPIPRTIPRDVIGGGKIHTFHGSHSTEPLVLESVTEEKFSSCKFMVDKGRQMQALGWIFSGAREDYQMLFGMGIDRCRGLWQCLLKAFTKIKHNNARVLDFADGSRLMLLEKPLGPFKPHELKRLLLENEAVSKKEKAVNIYGFQFLLNGMNWIPIIRPVVLQTADYRFRDRYSKIDYSNSATLQLNVAINRRPLTFTFDPLLAELGYAADQNGHNGLTDYWSCCLPLAKPPATDFNRPELSGIRPVANVPANKWIQFLKAIEGDRLEKMELVHLLERIAGESAVNEREPRLPKHHEINEGQCFRQPRSKISVFGSWIVSHCAIEGAKFYVVDSPLYGNALFLFRYLEGAEMAARHFESNGLRAHSRTFPGYVRKINHTHNWRANLTNTVYGFILNKPAPSDVELLG